MPKRLKIKTEAGQGGKLGHSNMSYWDENHEAKEDARQHRRLEVRQVIDRDLSEWGHDHDGAGERD